MCELLAMSSRHPVRLTFSLATLAAHGAPAGRTHDGWGAAFYQDKDVALFREPAAAGDSALVRFLESRGPSTTLAISHIRRATHGEVALANTQPLQRELAGRSHVFAHNGDVSGITQCADFALAHYHPVGTTDSEHAFCALLDRLRVLWTASRDTPPLEQRLAVVSEFAANLRRWGPANFLYSDSDTLFAHGHRRIQSTGKIAPPGLYALSRQCGDAQECIDCEGLSVGSGFHQVLLIASVPLSDEAWLPLAEGEVLAVTAGTLLKRNAG